jgi:hypothetical protein
MYQISAIPQFSIQENFKPEWIDIADVKQWPKHGYIDQEDYEDRKHEAYLFCK